MKKCILSFLVLVIILSFCGCEETKNMFGTRFGVAYFNKSENTPQITYTYYSEKQDKEIEMKLEDATFCDKLGEIIDGKLSGNKFCNCTGDYQVTIDNIWRFYLHPDRIVVYADLEDYTGFTVDCSEEEMKVLYEIIESKN